MTVPTPSPPGVDAKHLEIPLKVLVPPINFSLVAPGIYRSGHPNKKNFGFLRRLKLKGIMSVSTSQHFPSEADIGLGM